MSIDAKGFLSNEISDWIKTLRGEYAQAFALCESLSEFAQKMMLSLEPHNKCLPELLGASLLTRGISNLQGVILLAERGMVSEAKCLSRSLFEVTFAACAIAKDPGFADALCENDAYERKRCLNALSRLPHQSAERMAMVKEKLDEVRNQIRQGNPKQLSVKDIAIAGGLIERYDTAYKMFSGTVHASVRSLGDTLKVNDNGDVEEMVWGPSTKDLELVLIGSSDSLIAMLKALRQVYSLDSSDDLTLLERDLEAVWKNFAAKDLPLSDM
jgi:hypothetical protein